jgi:hypothetical protein
MKKKFVWRKVMKNGDVEDKKSLIIRTPDYVKDVVDLMAVADGYRITKGFLLNRYGNEDGES